MGTKETSTDFNIKNFTLSPLTLKLDPLNFLLINFLHFSYLHPSNGVGPLNCHWILPQWKVKMKKLREFKWRGSMSPVITSVTNFSYANASLSTFRLGPCCYITVALFLNARQGQLNWGHVSARDLRWVVTTFIDWVKSLFIR